MTLHFVLDPNFSDRLFALSSPSDIWICGSLSNDAAVKRLKSEKPDQVIRMFDLDREKGAMGTLINLLVNGEHQATWTELRVYGLEVDDRLKRALSRQLRTEILSSEGDHFIATRSFSDLKDHELTRAENAFRWLAIFFCAKFGAFCTFKAVTVALPIYYLLATLFIGGAIWIYLKRIYGPMMMAAAWIGFTLPTVFGKFSPIMYAVLILPAYLYRAFHRIRTRSESKP